MEKTNSAETRPDQKQLNQAAQTVGVETEYWDVWGKHHPASPETEEAILTSLGLDTSTHESLQKALEERETRKWKTPLPPTIVLVRGGSPLAIEVSIPAAETNWPAVLEIKLEDGDTQKTPVALSEMVVIEEGSLGRERFVRKRIPLPGDLPLGYHELTIRIGDQRSRPARLIVCPNQVYRPEWLEKSRTAGIAISLYGVRSNRNWGFGDITDLKAFTDWVAEQAGASFIALNPLHDIPNRQPYNISPYLPNSIFFRNPIYLDIERLEDFGNSPEAKALFASAEVRDKLGALRAAEFVEYEPVYGLKVRFLKLLFDTFQMEWASNTARAVSLRDYIDREGDLLHRFAVHAALDEAMHKENPDVWHWRQWPEQYQDPDSAATREFARKNERAVLYHKYVQWQLDLQFEDAQAHAERRGLSIGLYHDLALATDRFGADLWAHRNFFVGGCRVGAPPDIFSPKGQDWAFPPPNAEQHYQDGYRLFAESIRRNCRHGGALRIDHVMRFFRLYWIPDGMDATQGAYVRDRYNELIPILALESVRQKVVVVGEDLGTVPDAVHEALHEFGILNYRLLYFEHGHDGKYIPPGKYPRDALVSVTTHDLPTLAGFWLGRDIVARRAAGLLPDEATYQRMVDERRGERQRMLDLLHELKLLPEWFPRNAAHVPELTGELHNAIVGFLAMTPSKLMVLNQEDLLKETEQQNLPGTTAEYPNWRRKMKCTTEELWTSGEIQAFVTMFRSWLERSGRMNVPVGR